MEGGNVIEVAYKQDAETTFKCEHDLMQVDVDGPKEKFVLSRNAILLNRKAEQEHQLEITRQAAFKKLNNLLQISKKFSRSLTEELQKAQTKNGDEVIQSNKENVRNNEKQVKPEDDNSRLGKLQKWTQEGMLVECPEDAGKIKRNRHPKLFTGGEMHSYQLDGFKWLKIMNVNKVGCILADEMGLGKTIQAIAYVADLIERGHRGPFLICTPLSTIPNWVSEFKRFTPLIPVLLYHGDPEIRRDLGRQILQLHSFGSFKSYSVVVTTYELPMIDRLILRKFKWRALVIDEGHRIKNLKSQLRNILTQYRVDHKLLLTGTPLQNNLTELWSLLNFILPDYFNDLAVFESWFDILALSEKGGDEAIIAQEQERHIVMSMHEILSPFLLRRTKADVEISIPQKKEVMVYAQKTPRQEKFYQSTLDKTIVQLIKSKNEIVEEEEYVERSESGRLKRKCNYTEKIEKPKKEFALSLRLQNLMMHFRKICNHPYLVKNPLDLETGCPEISENIVEECGKLRVLDCLLKELKARGHKVLIFSFMVRMLEILQDYCDLRGWTFCVLEGKMNLSERCDQISQFNTNPDVFLFLISTRAGGLGVNLTAADTVIIYDSDWNPQVDLQAQDRCHRIGQMKPVMVYRLVTTNSIEERMVARAGAKRKLEKIIMKDGRFVGENKAKRLDQFSIEELRQLLTTTDHHETVQTQSDAVFTEEELNRLLDRSDLMAGGESNEKGVVKTDF